MEPLLSPDWYRVADLRPRLRPEVGVSRQTVRGETWVLLTDPLSGRHHRFNDTAWQLIAGCDGTRTLDEIWARCAAQLGADAPTQGETVRVVSQAFGANLLAGDVAPDAAAIVRAQRRGRRARTRAALHPLAFKVPLGDPDAWLDSQIERWRWLFTPAAARVLLAVVGLGALLLALHAADYVDYARSHAGSGRLLLLMWLVYPPVKALHEAAHALAVKAFGGEVHEVGVMLLMLTPVPYVDASASIAFADKRRRVAVAGAGIAVELVLASAALGLWLLLEPGLLKDLAFALLLVGGLSTLAVNGNPLLRFDGYHLLCDQLELPQLAQRSRAWWLTLLKRSLLRVQGLPFDGGARGAGPWLLAYAPLSWLYRGLLLGWTSVWLAGHSRVLGLAGLALTLWLCLLQPLAAVLRYVAAAPELRGQRVRAALVTLVAGTVLGGLLFGAELPHRSQAPGVVWLPDEALVRLGSDGFVDELLAADGDTVVAGQPVLRLVNDELQAERQRVQAQLARLEIERSASYDADPLRAAVADDERLRLRAEQARLEQREAQLLVRTAAAGRLVIPPHFKRLGQYLPQGEVVAQVLAPGAPLVRALVRNEDVAQVRQDARAIRVALAHDGGREADGHLVAAVPRASTALPSAALGDAAGGPIALDASDKTGRTAQEPRFQLDLRLDPGVPAWVGARALVTFEHTDASAAELIARFARRSFLRHFER